MSDQTWSRVTLAFASCGPSNVLGVFRVSFESQTALASPILQVTEWEWSWILHTSPDEEVISLELEVALEPGPSPLPCWQQFLEAGATWANAPVQYTLYVTLRTAYSSYLKKIYWSLADLQCCDSSRCSAKWINYTYIYTIPFQTMFSQRLLQSTELSPLCHTVGFCDLPILYIVVCIRQSQLPNLSLPRTFPFW